MIRRRIPHIILVVAGAGLVAGGGLGGCYRRVVGAKGFGASGTQIHQASTPDSGSHRERSLLKRESSYVPEKR